MVTESTRMPLRSQSDAHAVMRSIGVDPDDLRNEMERRTVHTSRRQTGQPRLNGAQVKTNGSEVGNPSMGACQTKGTCGGHTIRAPQKPQPGVYLEGDLLQSEAFSDLSKTEIRVLLRFYQKRQFGKKKGRTQRPLLNNGEIVFTYAEAEEMSIPGSTFTRAIDGLIESGLIDIASSGQGMYRSATKYSISERWRKYGTDQFVTRVRSRKKRNVGFNRDGKS